MTSLILLLFSFFYNKVEKFLGKIIQLFFSSAVPVRSRSPREPDVFELPPLPSSAVTDAKRWAKIWTLILSMRIVNFLVSCLWEFGIISMPCLLVDVLSVLIGWPLSSILTLLGEFTGWVLLEVPRGKLKDSFKLVCIKVMAVFYFSKLALIVWKAKTYMNMQICAQPWHCFSSMLAVVAEGCEDSFIMYHENVSSNFKKYLCTDKTGYFGSDFTHSSSEDEEMDIPILEQFQRQHLEVFSMNLT